MQNENTKQDTPFVRLELTNEQKAQVQRTLGREADAIELSAQELEERIAPRMNLRNY